MAQESRIEWTDATWNPVTGCSKTSPGCKNCYADRMARRLRAMGQVRYRNGFSLTLQPDVLDAPFGWKKPRLVFVNSMSDLFHEDVPVSYIRRVFSVMKRADWHVFQVLTKRAERLTDCSHKLAWPRNVWMGVSVETDAYYDRINRLASVPAAVRFLSLEPLLGPLAGLPLSDIDGVIVGGESGPRARPMQPDWVRRIRAQCETAGVPFFFKQWGGVRKSESGRTLDGTVWNAMPDIAGIRRPSRASTAASV